jgi:hypothetical protein
VPYGIIFHCFHGTAPASLPVAPSMHTGIMNCFCWISAPFYGTGCDYQRFVFLWHNLFVSFYGTSSGLQPCVSPMAQFRLCHPTALQQVGDDNWKKVLRCVDKWLYSHPRLVPESAQQPPSYEDPVSLSLAQHLEGGVTSYEHCDFSLY